MTAPAVPATYGKAQSGLFMGLLGIVLFLSVWEVTTRTGVLDDRFVPPASTVLITVVQYLNEPVFWTAVLRTVSGWALGLAIAAFAAIGLGIIIGSSDFLRKATHSMIEFLRPIPSVALIPLAVLVFGTSLNSTLLLVIYASFWQILIQVLYGVGDIDPVASDTAKSYRLGRVARVRYLVWPTALPYVMTGLRLGAAVALILAVTAELVIGGGGLGELISLAKSGGAVDKMYALIFVTGLLGVIVNVGMRTVEGKILSWHISVRGGNAS